MKESNVRVYVRVRPVMHEEQETPEMSCVQTTSDKSIELVNWRDLDQTICYDFEQVFSEDSTQEEVYCTTVSPVLSQFLELRQNASILTYGPTGSGKTYTLLGSNEQPGIIPRAMQSLFYKLRKMTYGGEVTVTLTMSYLEVYCEKVIDLLNLKNKNLPIHADKTGNIYVPGLTKIPITNFDSFEKIFIPASANRSVGCTKMNPRSSRSHSILMIQMDYHSQENPNKVQIAKLHLVDLAGSEDNRRTGNTGHQLKESGAINTSLHVFKKVVDALNPKFTGRIPYRESKLTRLLQDSIGGSSHTSLIINVAPEMSNIYDTTSALNFALKGKSVVNRAFTREIVTASKPIETPTKKKEDQSSTTTSIHPLISPFLQKNSSKFDKNLISKLLQLESNILKSKDNLPKSPAMQCTTSHEMCLQNIRKSAKKLKVLPEKRKLFTAEKEDLGHEDDQEDKENSPSVSQSSHTEMISYDEYLASPKCRRLNNRQSIMLTITKERNETTVVVNTTETQGNSTLLCETINSATEEELLKLPHIGPKRAKSILKYKEDNGRFTDIKQLENIFSSKFVSKMLQVCL